MIMTRDYVPPVLQLCPNQQAHRIGKHQDAGHAGDPKSCKPQHTLEPPAHLRDAQ